MMRHVRVLRVEIFVALCLFSVAIASGCSDDSKGPAAPPAAKVCNDLLDGPWMLIPDDYPTPEEGALFIVFDGHGIMSDAGGVNMASPVGSYTVTCGHDTT